MPTGAQAGRRRRNLGALGVATGLAVLAAACGGQASGSPTPAHPIVSAPAFTLQGCTYTVNDSIPAGEPHGVRPDVAAFAPDAAADAALKSIQRHRGTAMVDGTGVPGGTRLYAGPDASAAPVTTVPTGHSVIVAEPLIWTDARGGTWLAFFISCGGSQLYWASVDAIARVDPTAGATISGLVRQLAQAPPYTSSDRASLLPVVIAGGHLAWADPAVKLTIGRGELVQNP